MEHINLSVPATELVITSRDVALPVELAKIPHDVLRQVLYHGIKQKVADAASGAAMTIWQSVKGKDAPKPSRDQLRDFSEKHAATIAQETLACMEKARNAMYEGRWQVREAGGTSTKWTEEQSLALDMAKGALKAIFDAAAKRRNVKPTFENLCALSDKIAAYFDQSGKRPTWKDSEVMDWIGRQAEAANGVDYLAKAREEIAERQAAADAAMESLDDMLGDI